MFMPNLEDPPEGWRDVAASGVLKGRRVINLVKVITMWGSIGYNLAIPAISNRRDL
jgi:hypothetical protein